MRCRNFSIAYGILKEKNVPISSTVTPPARSFLPWTGTIRYPAVLGKVPILWVEVKDAYDFRTNSAFADAGIAYIGKNIIPYSSNGEYAGGFYCILRVIVITTIFVTNFKIETKNRGTESTGRCLCAS